MGTEQVAEPHEQDGGLQRAPSVFISYRRSETAGHAGRLYDAMASRFGDENVFMDVELQPGVDFVERITTIIAGCDVLLVVMGPDWAQPAEGQTVARIADPDDFVGLEVRSALRRPDVTVIPLLVAGARMPDPDELPEPLRDLTRRNALELSDLRWRYDVGRLVDVVAELLPPGSPPEPALEPAVAADDPAPSGTPSQASDRGRRRARSFGVVAGIVVVGVVALVLALATAGGPDAGSHAGASPGPAGAGAGPRPAGVPATCTDSGATQLAVDVDAQREWDCPIADTDTVSGTGLAYLEYDTAANARQSFIGSRQYELGHGYEPCPRAQSEALNLAGAREAWCAQSQSDASIEISWHGTASTVVGVFSCGRPTKVASAVKAWLGVV